MDVKRNQGSAKTLPGISYMLTVFITESTWDYNEKRAIYDKIFEARDWLIKQSLKYKKKVEFIGGFYGLKEDIIIKNIPVGAGTGKEPVDIVHMVLNKIGYKTPLDFYKQVKRKKKCDNVFVQIIANKDGRGYAIPFVTGCDKELYFLEGSILYNRRNGRGVLSAAIAHEILHLFGAWDLYHTFRQSKENELKARRIFPNDIMHRTSSNISELNIGKLTAYLVGLTNKKEDWFEGFNPN